jgi:hypothetical protein
VQVSREQDFLLHHAQVPVDCVTRPPGWQRSRSMALRSSSASRRQTVGSPFQKRKPAISCSPSICGMLTFKTAVVPFRSRTGATHAQLTSAPSNGSSSESAHLSLSSFRTPGSLASQAARSGILRQFAASRFGMVNAHEFLFCIDTLSPWPVNRKPFETSIDPAERHREGKVSLSLPHHRGRGHAKRDILTARQSEDRRSEIVASITVCG